MMNAVLSTIINLFLVLLSMTNAKNLIQDVVETTENLMEIDGIFPDNNIQNGETFDFIVLGAGSSGAVIANRLSEIEKWKILLLEAGKEEGILSEIPITTKYASLTTGDWNYTTETEESACLALEGRCRWPRGKALGGSSSNNYMIYSRGHPNDYDTWAKLGNTGWSYEDVFPYFLKSEREQMTDNIDRSYHSTDGLQSVDFPSWDNPLTQAYLKAGTEMGYDIVDYNSRTVKGFSKVQGTICNGVRASTAKSFLEPFLDRKNLHILKSNTVTKILLNETTKEAYGVEFFKNQKQYTAKARKEVIVSAGAINSPQLLMFSGIGPKEELTDQGIPLVQDLPVGKTLYDHPAFYGIVFSHDSFSSNPLTPSNILEYLLHRTGGFTSLGGVTALSFLNSENITNELPDIEFLLTTLPSLSTLEVPNQSLPTFSIIPIVLQPKSKGYIKLLSTDPYRHPIIKPNYYHVSEDLELMLKAVRFSLKLVQTKAFQNISISTPLKAPACKNYEFNTDDYWTCAIRQYTSTMFHPISTCKMGPATEQDAVVDAQLRVHGVERLRVADASIIPLPPRGHTNAIAIMIGEKAADMIKETWQ